MPCARLLSRPQILNPLFKSGALWRSLSWLSTRSQQAASRVLVTELAVLLPLNGVSLEVFPSPTYAANAKVQLVQAASMGGTAPLQDRPGLN